MMFTQEQINEIEHRLAKKGTKDTQLPSAKTPLTGDESIAIVQEGENRLIPVGSILNTDEGIFNVSEYLKVKTEADTSVILTLSEAVEACSSRAKKAGQIITFIDENKEWQRYQYQGYNVENWNQPTLWKDLNNISEDMPISEDVMSFNITEYMPGGSKYKQPIWAGIYTVDGVTPVSQYRLIFGCDRDLGEVEGIDMDSSDTLAIIDIDTDKVALFSYILFVGNSTDGYIYQTTILSDEDVPDWIETAFGNNSSYIAANIASLERKINLKLADKSSIVRLDDYVGTSKEMPNGYFMLEQRPVSQIRVLSDNNAYLLYVQASAGSTGTVYFTFENFDEYCDSWKYLNQYTEANCPTQILEAFGLNVATSNKKGMMSTTDKTNLDGSFKNVNYNSTTKKLIFTKNDNTTVELDATPFIKDGMVDSVSIADGYLVITFNTDSGKETIRIALTDIFNPNNYYTKAQADNLLGNKVDKEQGKGLSSNDYTTADKNKLNNLPTATELTETLGNKANTADLAAVATSGNYNDLTNKPTIPDNTAVEDGVDKTVITTGERYELAYATEQFKKEVTQSFTSITSSSSITFAHSGDFRIKGKASLQNSFSTTGKIYLVITSQGTSTEQELTAMSTSSDIYFDKTIYVNQGDVLSFRVQKFDYATLYFTVSLCTLTYYERVSLDNFVPKSNTTGLLKNDGTVDTTPYTTNNGTITEIQMNGSTVGTSGAVNLGTVLTTTTDNVTSGSATPITSGGVYSALQGYEIKLNFTTYSGTSLTLVKNNYYRFTNNPTSLAITLPSSPNAGDQCAFCVTTGSTFTGITFSGSYILQDGWAIGADATYEVIALYNGSIWLVTATKFTL